MVRLQVQDAGAVAVLTLPQNLTPHHADTLKTLLRRSLEQKGRLIVDCGKVAAVHADCLLILCAALRLSKQLGKDFVLAGHRPGAFLEAAQDARDLHCGGCGMNFEEGCVWDSN